MDPLQEQSAQNMFNFSSRSPPDTHPEVGLYRVSQKINNSGTKLPFRAWRRAGAMVLARRGKSAGQRRGAKPALFIFQMNAPRECHGAL